MIFITQPTYFPWIGYFGFLDLSNEVIFLDDVQFSKRSWQQRNKILFNNNFKYITTPVKSKGKRDQLIQDVQIYNEDFYKDHLKIIQSVYKKTPYFKETYFVLEGLSEEISKLRFISDINIMIIRKICEILNINIFYSRSSELNIKKKKSLKLAEICKVKSYSNLLSNEGTIKYLTEDKKIFKKNNIMINFYKYENITYNQDSDKFIEGLSIIDLIFHEGPNSINIIRKGMKKILSI